MCYDNPELGISAGNGKVYAANPGVGSPFVLARTWKFRALSR
jgi:hypothetical protein